MNKRQRKKQAKKRAAGRGTWENPTPYSKWTAGWKKNPAPPATLNDLHAEMMAVFEKIRPREPATLDGVPIVYVDGG